LFAPFELIVAGWNADRQFEGPRPTLRFGAVPDGVIFSGRQVHSGDEHGLYPGLKGEPSAAWRSGKIVARYGLDVLVFDGRNSSLTLAAAPSGSNASGESVSD
jgi:hypothetical protein